MKKYILPLLFLSIFSATACKDDKGMVEATVIDTKDLTHIGCGYVLQLKDSALLEPINLPSAYQHHGIKVKMEYEHTGIKDTCQFGTVIYDLISIKEIKNDLK